MKCGLLLVIALVSLDCISEGGESSKPMESLFPQFFVTAAKERADLKRAGLISNRYKPQLLFEVAAAQAGKQNPLSAAKTPPQRRFLTEYLKVQAEGDLMRERPDYQWVEPLRRCGIPFPPGARILWLPFNPPLVVIQTPRATRQIEKYMGLEPHP